MHTFVIAEAASTHDGDYDQMLRLIDLASIIGADACKFQWVSSAERLCERRKAPEYLESYRLLEFPKDELYGLTRYCEARGVEFMCTVYLPEDIEVIAPYVKRFKVASFEAMKTDMVEGCLKYGETIVSLGMQAIMVKWPSHNIAYLHCISAYPTPVEEINLSRLRVWGISGLSDHTKHPWTGGLAVACGAQIIEFHMRLHDTDPKNADYEVSRDPEEAGEYVTNIRLTERMLGDGLKKVQPSEEKMLRYRVQ